MAKRRLYGVTQKRRKKKSTQALKRQGSVTRVQSTHQPFPFQRSGELETGDIVFLEAMRDMGVAQVRREGETPARQENFERVRFAARREQEALFGHAMSRLGVKPLKQKGLPNPPRKAEKAHGAGTRLAAQSTAPSRFASEGAAGEGDTGTPESGRPKRPPANAGRDFRGMKEESAGRAPASKQPPRPVRAPGVDGPAISETRFEWNEEDAELMASTLSNSDFDPADKYEGAPKRPKPEPVRLEAGEGEPDGELDLHGKTQEEAIRMVQNFLLTSHRQKLREVLIITGKGLNSGEGGPVLREAVKNWLERNGGRFAASFGWAPARHGGDGAIWVTLRQSP